MYKEYFEGKKAVCFDLDGTLIDSDPYWDQAFMNVLETVDENAVFPDVSLTGLSVSDKWEKVLRIEEIKTEISPKELCERTKKELLKLYEEPMPKDGFWPLALELKQEKGMRLALTTNTDRDVVDKLLSKMGIKETFDFIICGDEVKRRKPNPEIYKTVAKKLELKTENILVFEDSVVGATSARKAKMDVIVIWDGVIDQREYPKGIDLFVSDFESFPGNLDHTLLSRIEEVSKELEEKGILTEEEPEENKSS